MKPVLQTTYTGHSDVESLMSLGLVGITQNPSVEAQSIQESIDRRANNVGSVLEEIMQDMEAHSHWGLNE